MGRSLSFHLTLLVLLATHANVRAVTVHTWIDGDGVRHYSDEPPASATADPRRFVIADTPAAASDEDYYSIVNQWQRMREERDESKAHRLEREQIRSEERVAKAAARADEARYNGRGYAVVIRASRTATAVTSGIPACAVSGGSITDSQAGLGNTSQCVRPCGTTGKAAGAYVKLLGSD